MNHETKIDKLVPLSFSYGPHVSAVTGKNENLIACIDIKVNVNSIK